MVKLIGTALFDAATSHASKPLTGTRLPPPPKLTRAPPHVNPSATHVHGGGDGRGQGECASSDEEGTGPLQRMLNELQIMSDDEIKHVLICVVPDMLDLLRHNTAQDVMHPLPYAAAGADAAQPTASFGAGDALANDTRDKKHAGTDPDPLIALGECRDGCAETTKTESRELEAVRVAEELRAQLEEMGKQLRRKDAQLREFAQEIRHNQDDLQNMEDRLQEQELGKVRRQDEEPQDDFEQETEFTSGADEALESPWYADAETSNVAGKAHTGGMPIGLESEHHQRTRTQDASPSETALTDDAVAVEPALSFTARSTSAAALVGGGSDTQHRDVRTFSTASTSDLAVLARPSCCIVNMLQQTVFCTEGSNLRVYVFRAGALDHKILVSYATVDDLGTAQADRHYVSTRGTCTFDVGCNMCHFDITVLDDEGWEPIRYAPL